MTCLICNLWIPLSSKIDFLAFRFEATSLYVRCYQRSFRRYNLGAVRKGSSSRVPLNNEHKYPSVLTIPRKGFGFQLTRNMFFVELTLIASNEIESVLISMCKAVAMRKLCTFRRVKSVLLLVRAFACLPSPDNCQAKNVKKLNFRTNVCKLWSVDETLYQERIKQYWNSMLSLCVNLAAAVIVAELLWYRVFHSMDRILERKTIMLTPSRPELSDKDIPEALFRTYAAVYESWINFWLCLNAKILTILRQNLRIDLYQSKHAQRFISESILG